jgi:hypothetical protein
MNIEVMEESTTYAVELNDEEFTVISNYHKNNGYQNYFVFDITGIEIGENELRDKIIEGVKEYEQNI